MDQVLNMYRTTLEWREKMFLYNALIILHDFGRIAGGNSVMAFPN